MSFYSVSSWFIDQAQSTNPDVARKFTIGSSDYSDRVLRWPKFKQAWNDIRPQNLTLQLANEDRLFNFFLSDRTKMRGDCTLSMGFTHPTSGDELVTLFSGKTHEVSYRKGAVDITLVDKFQQLTDRVVGTSDAPVTFAGSNYLASDLAWWAVTSYGGFDATANSSNTDINYQTFADWSDVMSSNAIYMNAHFDGQKVVEVLRKIGKLTFSAIYVLDGKLNFHRFSVVDSSSTDFDSSNVIDMELDIIMDDVVNRQFVSGDYSVDSDYFGFTVYNEEATSVNSYGLKEDIEDDKNVWHANSGSALDLAQRYTLIYGYPFDRVTINSNLSGLPRSIGETANVTDVLLETYQGYRIMSYEVDMDKGAMTFTGDRTQFGISGGSGPYPGAFTLDTSSLDGVDILT